VTLGCKVNQYETQAMEGLLGKRGHELVKPGEGCDICILNTCAVTAESVRKSRQAIRRLKKTEPDAMIAVCGCYSQLDSEDAAGTGADLVGGTNDRYGFALKVEEIVDRNRYHEINTLKSNTQPGIFEELPPGSPSGRTRALLKIQDGCDNFCTYCIVPYIRGRSRSLPPDRIAKYAKQLEEQGYKEIIITGIEISSYGKDFKTGKTGDGSVSYSPVGIRHRTVPCLIPCLITAIQTISAAAPNTRLRLGSLDPAVITEEFCQSLKKIPGICSHFHLSLQSGCDDTLHRMGRKYNTDYVHNAILTLKKYFNDCAITADLITGFPGETEEEFNQTLEFIKKIKFTDMHIFPYSPRPGTKAADMPDQIEMNIRKKRANTAAEEAAKAADEYKKNHIGKVVEVLFEQEKNGYSTGHSSNYLEVSVKGKIDKNSLYNVKISGIKNGYITGEII